MRPGQASGDAFGKSSAPGGSVSNPYFAIFSKLEPKGGVCLTFSQTPDHQFVPMVTLSSAFRLPFTWFGLLR